LVGIIAIRRHRYFRFSQSHFDRRQDDFQLFQRFIFFEARQFW
jgi:hypothetical protein